MEITARSKPGGARKKLPGETSTAKDGEIELKKGQRVIIEFEAVDKQEGLTSLAAIDFQDLLAGKCISGVFKVNKLTLTT